jgi:hypothetical protein
MSFESICQICNTYVLFTCYNLPEFTLRISPKSFVLLEI